MITRPPFTGFLSPAAGGGAGSPAFAAYSAATGYQRPFPFPADVIHWFRARNLASGIGSVLQWADESGYRKHITTPTTSEAPVLNFNEGRAEVKFDGSNDILRCAVILGTTTNQTWYAVIRNTESSEGGCVIKNGEAAPQNGVGLGVGNGTMDSAGTELIGLYEGVRWLDSNIPLVFPGYNIIGIAVDSSGVPTLFNKSSSTTLSGTNMNTPTVWTSYGSYAATRPYKGAILEAGGFNKFHAATERQAMIEYLAAENGI